MDNVIKSMYVTINSPAGLSTKADALGVRAEGNEKEEKEGNRKALERMTLQDGPIQLAPVGLI